VARLDDVSQPSSAEVPVEPVAGPESESESSPEPEVEPVADPVAVVLRRAPRYRPFVGSGMAVGAVVLLAAGLVAVRGAGFSTLMVPFDLVLVGILVGGLVGAGLALALERRDRS